MWEFAAMTLLQVVHLLQVSLSGSSICIVCSSGHVSGHGLLQLFQIWYQH